jgi:acetoin utilization deacetylase AcuC-like enzyme
MQLHDYPIDICKSDLYHILMKKIFVYSDRYICDIGIHVFPIDKFKRLYEKLISESKIPKDLFMEPRPATNEELELVHTKEYLDDLYNLRWTQRTAYSEMILTKEIVDLSILSCGGTIIAAEYAIENKTPVMHLSGGWHHAFPDHAEGFCYINDIAVAIRKVKHDGKIKKAAVIDCDLHQGNGTAYIFKNDDDVFTFSIHQENLYPVKQKSDLDIGLDDFTQDDEYLEKLEDALRKIFHEFHPEFVIYQAGADPYEHDQLGLLKITMNGLKKRDELVMKYCKESNIPFVITLGGGYALDTEDTIKIHYNTALIMLNLFFPTLILE